MSEPILEYMIVDGVEWDRHEGGGWISKYGLVSRESRGVWIAMPAACRALQTLPSLTDRQEPNSQ